ncbi:unnamed protein product [Cyclocybe aegerita]|uniref:Uncharacterized protein n=1 Tax=Cyclocybe aegerita TaxID=1973307 RepID=A0A8S0WRV5_CYCAE|nr:unnamed protein product [Cyclocybe aegerita]
MASKESTSKTRTHEHEGTGAGSMTVAGERRAEEQGSGRVVRQTQQRCGPDYGRCVPPAAGPAKTSMARGYDLDIRYKDDYYVGVAEAAVSRMSQALFPGAARFTHKTKELTDQMLTVPLRTVEIQLAGGTAVPGAVARLLERCKSERRYEVIEQQDYQQGCSIALQSFVTSKKRT